jgi:Outer membrane protein beta-barrel domain
LTESGYAALDSSICPAYDPGVLKCVLALGLMLSAAGASAQSVFVQGSVGSEIKRFSGEPGNSVFDGTARAVTVGAGGHIMPHWSVGAELDLGARSTTTTTTSVSVSGQNRDIHNAYTSQRRSASALIGYQTSIRHGVQVGYYAGMSFSTVRREIASDAEAVVLQTPAPTSIYTDRLAGPIVGIDAAIRVAPHAAVVVGLRAQGLTLSGDLGGHSIRPSIGARFSF